MPDEEKRVEVPGVGIVAFPASMSDEDIGAAIRKQRVAMGPPNPGQSQAVIPGAAGPLPGFPNPSTPPGLATPPPGPSYNPLTAGHNPDFDTLFHMLTNQSGLQDFAESTKSFAGGHPLKGIHELVGAASKAGMHALPFSLYAAPARTLSMLGGAYGGSKAGELASDLAGIPTDPMDVRSEFRPLLSDIGSVAGGGTMWEHGPAVWGGVKGAAKGAVEPVMHGTARIPIPASVVGAGSGATAAHFSGIKPWIGAAVGGAAPIVRGAYRGVREALGKGEVVEQPRLNPSFLAPLPKPMAEPPEPGRLSPSFLAPLPKIAAPEPAPPAVPVPWGAARSSMMRNVIPDVGEEGISAAMPAVSPAELPKHQRPLIDLGGPPGATMPVPPAPAPIQPVEGAPLGSSAVPKNAPTFRHDAAHTDLIRQSHAAGAELGFKHADLSAAAKKVYGVDSYSKLSYDQALALHEYMLKNKQLPVGPKDLLPK